LRESSLAILQTIAVTHSLSAQRFERLVSELERSHRFLRRSLQQFLDLLGIELRVPRSERPRVCVLAGIK
jgi:hypothetical protein